MQPLSGRSDRGERGEGNDDDEGLDVLLGSLVVGLGEEGFAMDVEWPERKYFSACDGCGAWSGCLGASEQP